MSDAAKTIKARVPRLGRGLSSLMAQPIEVPIQVAEPVPSVITPPQQEGAAADGMRYLSVTALHPNPHQPRQHFDADGLQRLADSIKTAGMMQPIIVRPMRGNGAAGFQIVAGERRWRSAQLAGLETVPAIVKELEDGQLAEWALIENLQREDLNPLERAHAFARLIEQFGLTHEQVAQRVGVERSTITNALRLLNLHPTVQDMLRQGLISGGQAKALTVIADQNRQLDLAKRTVREDWSVRRLENQAKQAPQPGSPLPPTPTPRAAHFADLEKQIGHSLGTKVHIKPGRRKGTGTLSIDFFSIDQFEALLGRLGVKPE